MSRIKQITGVESDVIQFRKNVSALHFVVMGSVESLSGPTFAVDFITDIIAECFISNTTKGKRVTFFPRMRLMDLVEISTENKERIIEVTAISVNDPIKGFITTPYKFEFQLDLTDGANGIEIGGDDDVFLKLDGLKQYGIYTVMAVEESDVDNSHKGFGIGEVIAYDYQSLSTKQEKNAKFSTQGKLRMAIPVASAFKSLDITFKNGSRKTLEIEDIAQQMRDSFGTCYETNTQLQGIKITAIEKLPRLNHVIPLSDDMTYVQLNVDEVLGTVPSLPILFQSYQVVSHDIVK